VDSPPARSEQTLIGTDRQQLEAFLDDNRSDRLGSRAVVVVTGAATG
jgi:hypothetical protein